MLAAKVFSFQRLPTSLALLAARTSSRWYNIAVFESPSEFDSSFVRSLQVLNIVGDEQMEELGSRFAGSLGPGQVLLLRGDLGAGKSTFSRGLIRALCSDPDMIVTSPSYLLDNVYEYSAVDADTVSSIHHMDLYRLPNGCDLSFLSIPAIFKTSLCLVEWPERLGNFLPSECTMVNFKINADESRDAEIQFIGGKYQTLHDHLKQYSL